MLVTREEQAAVVQIHIQTIFDKLVDNEIDQKRGYIETLYREAVSLNMGESAPSSKVMGNVKHDSS